MKYAIATAVLIAATKFIAAPMINKQVDKASEQQKQHMYQLVKNQ